MKELIDALAKRNINMPAKEISTEFVRWGDNYKYYAKAMSDGCGWIFGDWSTGFCSYVFKKDACISRIDVEREKELERINREKELAIDSVVEKFISFKNTNNIDHEYLRKKMINSIPKNVKVNDRNIIIPIYKNKKITSYQTITVDGKKLMARGGDFKGGYFPIGIPKKVIYVCEGFATACSVHQATKEAVAVAFSASNIIHACKSIIANNANIDVIIAADNDHSKDTNTGLLAAQKAAKELKLKYVYPLFDDHDLSTDYNDIYVKYGGAKVVEALAYVIEDYAQNGSGKISVKDLLNLDLKKRNNLLSPWLPEQGICLLYAPPGIGKTFFSLNVAYAVATANKFLTWQATKKNKVLYIDGEMAAIAMRDRIKTIFKNNKDCTNFEIITPDLQNYDKIDLSKKEYQQELDKEIKDVKLIIVDNISTLCGNANQNDTDSWAPVQTWALRMRAEGRSVLFVHHASKSGKQRGTSMREDVQDTIISLSRPDDYSEEMGAAFLIRFEKARGFFGYESESITAYSVTKNNEIVDWEVKNSRRMLEDKIICMANSKMKNWAIAKELEVKQSFVNNVVNSAKYKGLVNF